jgi:hypothetical protein
VFTTSKCISYYSACGELSRTSQRSSSTLIHTWHRSRCHLLSCTSFRRYPW